MSGYFVYENWRARGHRTKTHIGSCGHCNEGQGKTKTKPNPANALWHGPFDSLADATTFAKALKAPVNEVDSCITRSTTDD